jgi:hypothetical protein
MDAEYDMDLKIQSSNWNQYNRMEEGYFRTAIGNVDNNVLTYCCMDKRMIVAERNKDTINACTTICMCSKPWSGKSG